MKGRRVIRCWPGAAGAEVGVKGQIFKTIETLASIKANSGPGEEGSERLSGKGN